jgi:hypothetical protein
LPRAPGLSLKLSAAWDGEVVERTHARPTKRKALRHRVATRCIASVFLYQMTLFAIPLDERRVHVALEEVPILRRVWRMTGHAVDRRRFYVEMGLREGVFRRIVTFIAERLERLVQQCRLIRRMRNMAIQAVFGGGVVRPLGFHRLLHGLVTAETEIWTLGQEKRVESRFVRIVAVRAVAFLDGRVRALGRRHIIADLVTLHADRSLLIGKDTSVLARVRRMAGQTLTAVERVVGDGLGVFSHQVVVALGAERRIDRPEQIAFVGTVAAMACDAIAAPHRRMDIGLEKLVLELRMTGIADRIRSPDQDGGGI